MAMANKIVKNICIEGESFAGKSTLMTSINNKLR